MKIGDEKLVACQLTTESEPHGKETEKNEGGMMGWR